MRSRWLALLLVGAASSRAADVVVLDASGDDAETRALSATLTELLTRLEVQLRDQGEGLARVKVELGETESSVSIFTRGNVLAMFRRLPRASTPALTIEAVAHVVQSAVEELVELERHPPPVASKPLSPPPIVVLRGGPPLVTAPPPRGGVGLELAPMIGGRSFASNAPFVFGGGVAASLLVDVAGAWTPRMTLLGLYNGPFDAAGSAVEIAIQSVSLRALGGVRWTSGRFGVDLQLGGGADALLMSAHSSYQVMRDHAEWSPTITALAGVRYSLTDTTDLFLAVTGDVDLLPRRFLVQDTGGAKDLLVETWRVRPALMLGFSFDLIDPRSAR